MAMTGQEMLGKGVEDASGKLSGIALVFVLAVFGIAFLGTIQGITARWMKLDEAYSHGFLVLAISVYLMHRSMVSLWPLRISPNPVGLLLLAAGVLLWAASRALFVEVVEEFVLPGILWSLLFSVFGWRQARNFIVPVGFLYFAIPFWDYLSETLQLITVAVTDLALSLLGIRAEIEGVFVELPGIGTFEVAHGCSGLRYLVVGLTLTTLFGYLNYSRWSRRLALIALGVALSLAANWIRVCVIIYVGYETNMQSSLIEDHESFGWIVFAITLIPLFWFANRMAMSDPAPAITRTETTKAAGAKTLSLIVGAILAVVLLPLWLIGGQADAELDGGVTIRLDSQLRGWRSVPIYVPTEWAPIVRGYSQKVETQYFNDEQKMLSVGVYYYRRQGPGKELVQDSNRLYDAKAWKVLKADNNVFAGDALYNNYVFQNKLTNRNYAVAQGYYVAGLPIADRVEAKLTQALGYLHGRHDASMFTVSMLCETECESEQALLANFVELNRPSILAAIDDAHAEESRGK